MSRSHRNETRGRRAGSLAVVAITMAAMLFTAGSSAAGNAPDFKLKDLDGKWFRLADEVGDQVIYVTFWATWCVPCRREMPHLEELWQDFGDKGLLVVGVNTDPAAAKSKIKPFVKRHRVTYPTILDPDNNVLDAYNPTRELPFAVLIDQNGDISKSFPGYRPGDEIFLREFIVELLGDTADEAETTDQADAGDDS